MATANEELLDALVRHQIGLLRYSGTVQRKIDRLLAASDEDIGDRIRGRLAAGAGYSSRSSAMRLERLLRGLRETRLTTWRDITALWVQEMRELAKTEAAHVAGIVQTVSPVVLQFELPEAQRLNQIVSTEPFRGRVLRGWARNVAQADIQRIQSQIRIGLVEGESNAQIARRVVGSARLRGADGVTNITRRQSEAITRTAVNHISNRARGELYAANPEVFQWEVWVSTLDHRTTLICQTLDGTRFRPNEGRWPPAHMQCRSIRIPVLDGELLGVRPARNFTERQLLREFTDQRRIARVTERARLPRGTRGPYDEFKRRRVRELTGRVPARTTYPEWLARQSAAFQDDVLGQTRGRLFRRGGLKIDRFVDRAGARVPLRELARREAAAFRAAGLDPEDFLG